MTKGMLVVVSGPAGVGKGTVLRELVDGSEYKYSVSATTRAPRPGEVEGINYHYLTREKFEERISRGEMLEWAEYVGNLYGTPRREAEQWLDEGCNVILEIEMVGALKVKAMYPEALLIFMLPPTIAGLEARLRGRGTEDEPTIRRRLEQMRLELFSLPYYDYAVVNEDEGYTVAADKIRRIVAYERSGRPAGVEISLEVAACAVTPERLHKIYVSL